MSVFPGKRELRKLPSNWLYLVRLECKKTEDNAGADEAYITVNGRMVWGIVSVNDGENCDLESVTEPIRFRNSVQVQLWDNDTGIFDSDDLLGTNVVRPDAEFPYDEEQTLDFADDDANYTLTYVISKEGP